MRPLSTSASTSVHGPWQITPTGFSCSKNARTKLDGVLVGAQEVRVGDAARAARARRSRRPSASATVLSTVNVSPLSRWLKAWTSPSSTRDQLRRAAGLLDRLPRLGQLHLLDALGGEERDRLACQFSSHGPRATHGLQPFHRRRAPGSRTRMGYVIAGVAAVILIIAGFIAFLVMNSMKKNDVSDAGIPAPTRTRSASSAPTTDARGRHERARGSRTRRRTRPGRRRTAAPAAPLRASAATRRPRGRPTSGGRRSGGRTVRALTFWTGCGEIEPRVGLPAGRLGTNAMSRRTDALHSPAGAPQPSSSVNEASSGAPRLR